MILAAVAFFCATLDQVFPLLHRPDPDAHFVFHQWPLHRGKFDSYGVTLMVSPDRATLIIDDKAPMSTQLRTLPQNLSATKAAKRLRVMRWDFTAQQCPAIPSLYESLVALPPEPQEIDQSGEQPIHGWMPNRQEMCVRRGDDSAVHFKTTVGWYAHALAFQEVWKALEACSQGVKGQRVRAR